MPFKKRDGRHYFERVEAFDLPKEHEANNLALCPVCAAKYSEFVVHDPCDERRRLQQALLNGEDRDVPLVLGNEKNASIHFAPAHFVDLKVMLEALSQGEMGG